MESLQHLPSVQPSLTWAHLLGQINYVPAISQDLTSENYAEVQSAEAAPFLRLPSGNSVISHAEPVAGISDQTARQARKAAGQRVEFKPVSFLCLFPCIGEGAAPVTGTVSVVSVPPKGAIRVREKLHEYEKEHALWPLTASILDPVSHQSPSLRA